MIIGTALTIRALVGERRIFRREQEVGLSAPAYLTAKITVYGLAAALWTAVVVAIVIAVKGEPGRSAVLLHNAAVELYVSVAVTAIVSAVVGLALSSLGKSLREVLPLVVPVILASALFNGSLVQLVSRWGLQQISWFVPAQWGFAAAASTVGSAQGRLAGRQRRDVDPLQRLVGVRHGDARPVRCHCGRVHALPAAVAPRREPPIASPRKPLDPSAEFRRRGLTAVAKFRSPT